MEVSRKNLSRVRKQRFDPEYTEPVVSRSGEVEKLQEMVQTLQQPRTDPDMDALNGTLRELVALQQPKEA